MHNSYSSYVDITKRVNIRSSFFQHLWHVFEKHVCDVTSYANDNAPHTCDSDLYTVHIICWHGLRKNIWNQMVINATSLTQLENPLVSIFREGM